MDTGLWLKKVCVSGLPREVELLVIGLIVMQKVYYNTLY